jgi:predicted DNA-binding transcriptional regulator AlpA
MAKSANITTLRVEPMPDRLWKVQDVMNFLGISRPQVYKHIKRGLRAKMLDDEYRFFPADVKKYADSLPDAEVANGS